MSLNIRHINFVIVLFVLFLCLLVRNVVCTLVCTADSCIYARFLYEPYVEFTVSEIVFYEILIMLGIKFTTKTE